VAIRSKKEIGSLGKMAKVSKKVIGITSLELRNFGMETGCPSKVAIRSKKETGGPSK
jgi:hypothetical protein